VKQRLTLILVAALTLRGAFETAALAAAPRPFQLPTDNCALFEPGGEERYFVGTVGRPWSSGTFGCVRTGGTQLHEGIDIRCLRRDQQGEPTDPVRATADGTVAYFNTNPGLSTYGRYLILRHQIEGLEIYSIYAHLRQVQPGLKPGQPVSAGQVVATMGRSTSTREGISKERAHLHFELALLANERFAAWHKQTFPTQRNDHGGWNGRNFVGLDPRALLLAAPNQGARFSLLQHLRSQRELCRVQVRVRDFPWVRRYAALKRSNPRAEHEGVAGYELALNFNGVAFELVPLAAGELRSQARYHLLSVNEAEQQRCPCGHLVARRGGRWELTAHGQQWLGLLTY